MNNIMDKIKKAGKGVVDGGAKTMLKVRWLLRHVTPVVVDGRWRKITRACKCKGMENKLCNVRTTA
jgi:hypothetical protein